MQWEEDITQEEEYQYQPHPEFSLAFQKEQQYACETLVVAQFGPASLFAHSLIGSAPLLNRLNFSKAKQQALADLYRSNTSGTLYLIFNDLAPPMKEIYFSKFLEKTIKCEKIILLMAVSSNTLKQPNSPPLTCISTSSLSEVPPLPRFSEGVMGLQADILGWGELKKVPVCGFIAAMKEYEFTSKIIEQAFGSLRGKYGLDGHFDIADKVKRYNIKKASNKLYL